MKRLAARLLPAPWVSLMLFVAWPMLNESASPGQLLLGALLAVVVPWFTERWRPDKARLSSFGTVLRLTGAVLADIVRSNVVVARLVLGPEGRITPRFVWVPLTIRDPHGIVVLAGIITMTPGTLSAELSDDRRHLLVHCFDVDDDETLATIVADIKARYEAPLIRIFEKPEPR